MTNYLCNKAIFSLNTMLDIRLTKANATPKTRTRISKRVGGVSCIAKFTTIKKAIRYVKDEKNLLNLLDILNSALILSFAVSLALSISYFFQAKNTPAIAAMIVITSVIAILISVVNKIKVYHILKNRKKQNGGVK